MPEKQTKKAQKNNTDEAVKDVGLKSLGTAIGVDPERLKAAMDESMKLMRQGIEDTKKRDAKLNEQLDEMDERNRREDEDHT